MRHAERHRALWAPLLEAPGFERELGIMEALAVKMASAVPAGASRQTDEQGWPLRNLDELYAQAEDVDPVFGAKVAHWASVSYAEPMPAAELKRPRRAMQKVHRVYNGDASRLRDLSRRALIFRDVSRMRRCLEAIHRDEEVEVAEVKNRMARNGQSPLGYRDICLRLRFKGATRHLVELQLLLLEFWREKIDGGHLAYVGWRNERGH